MKTEDVLVLRKRRTNLSQVRGATVLSTRSAIHEALFGGRVGPSRRSAAWLALDSESLDMLLEEVQRTKARANRFGTLAIFQDATPSALALANRYFRTVSQTGLHWLPPAQLTEILHLDEPGERFICGMVDRAARNLLAYRGDFQPVIVPLSSFDQRAVVKPDFDDFEVIDWGNAIRFGEYEAATDAVLYENDPDYRRRLRRRRHTEDKTFGASLRRLRLQKALRQSDFEPEVSAKTIARIENNQVAKPHGRTLREIADRLGVKSDEIETY